ncbi:MAG: alpha/beta hydrolase [Pseudomonadota bacterium]
MTCAHTLHLRGIIVRQITLAPDRAPAHAPQLAGDRALRLFCRPDLSRLGPDGHAQLAAKARPALRRAAFSWTPSSVGDLATYVFAPKSPPVGTVLCVHGWSGEAAFMAAFSGPLVHSGLRVVLFDNPAHGRSGGRRSSIIEMARATLAVADRFGPIDTVIAHSVGCFATLLALEGGPPLGRHHPFEKLCLIAAPNHFGDVVHRFADQIDLPPAARRCFERGVARASQRTLRELNAADFLRKLGVPTLLVHARDDDCIPVADGAAIAAVCPNARLKVFDGLGHGRVLYAPPVIREVRSFALTSLYRAAAE